MNGEPDALKGARPVRKGIERKGLATAPRSQSTLHHRPTMRWIFQCFEGIDLLHIRMGSHFQTQVLGLQALHQRFFVCSVLRIHNSIFSLPKLRNVGSGYSREESIERIISWQI
jgi:hypothetical protein